MKKLAVIASLCSVLCFVCSAHAQAGLILAALINHVDLILFALGIIGYVGPAYTVLRAIGIEFFGFVIIL